MIITVDTLDDYRAAMARRRHGPLGPLGSGVAYMILRPLDGVSGSLQILPRTRQRGDLARFRQRLATHAAAAERDDRRDEDAWRRQRLKGYELDIEQDRVVARLLRLR